MSKVDVVPCTGTGTAPPSVPSLGSAMAAAAAVATTASATNTINSTTATMSPSTPTPLVSTIANTPRTASAGAGIGSAAATTNPTISTRPLAITAATITTGVLQQAQLSAHARITAHSHPHPLTHSHSQQARTNGTKRPRPSDHRDSRIAKSRQRPVSSKSSSSSGSNNMEPPVLSFYGTQPVPLPSRFASLKKRLVAGHEAALEASWSRLIAALRDEIKYIDEHRTGVIPCIDFTDIHDTAKVAPFESSLKRHGIGVIRGVVSPEDASRWVEETKKYLETQHDFKAPPAQDPTCFDFFWTPAQVRSRAHPNMLQAQRFAMSLWNVNNDSRLATRFPITYADRIRIESTNNGIITVNGVAAAPVSPEDSLIAAAAAASNASIAQVDNGSLERWELDGYGRCGLYDEIFRGNWEAYNPWDPAGRVNATSDLYNGAGACSMMRMFQGILALTVVEPGMIRLLPSPKLSTAYFLLRPFFSPKEPAPEEEEGSRDAEAWARYLDPANWALDKEQSTIIHGAVPGHAQRVTAAWHPHLELNKSLVTPPTLQVGDYIVWHPDQAYQFSNNTNPSSTPTKPDDQNSGSALPVDADGSHTSMLVYSPAAPLTQTNALFLARQRKAFLRGHPGPDFDSTGTGLGSEAPHTGRPGEKEIREVGGEEGLRAMGLAPWTPAEGRKTSSGSVSVSASASADATPKSSSPTEEKKDVEMMDDGNTGTGTDSPASTSSSSRAESEVVRLANIILFPDRYDFYMPTRASSPVPTSREREKERERERERGREKEGDKDKEMMLVQEEQGNGIGKGKTKELSISTSPNDKNRERGKRKER